MKHGSRLLSLALVAVVAAGAALAANPRFTSPEDALRQGVAAFRGGYYETALPALEHAAAKHMFLGQFFLAQIYADNAGAHTDHAKAYVLFERIADEYADVDPDDDQRAPYVAKSMTALARYLRSGIPEINVKPNPERAAEILHSSATIFADEEAQFELAKMLLKGDGVEVDIARGRHWLSALSQKGHAGAQALLADMLWRGNQIEKDHIRSFALIRLALENAPPADRVWIEDIYHNIFCGAGQGIRKQATGMVAEWRDRYGRKPEASNDRSGLGVLTAEAQRSCANGEPVQLLPLPDSATGIVQGRMPEGRREALQGATGVPSLRDVGTTRP
jgi:hypothetical protein